MPSIKERISALEKKSGRDSRDCKTDEFDWGSRSASSSRPLSAPATLSISEKLKALNINVKNSNMFADAPSAKENHVSTKSKPGAVFRTCGSTQPQIGGNNDFMSSPGKVELSTDGICTEVDQKKEVGELTGTSITKSGSGVYEEKEQLQESSATEEELYLMDGITDLSASIRKMIDVANSEPPPQAEDDEGIAVVVNTPPSQTVAQPSSSPILDSPSGLMSSGIAARAAKIKTAFAAPEPTQKHILHCNSPPRNISTVSGNCPDDLESTQQSHPLSISDRIKMGGIGMPLPAFVGGGSSNSPPMGAMLSSADINVTNINERNTVSGNNMSHCQLDRPVQPRKRPPKTKTAFKPVSTLDTI